MNVYSKTRTEKKVDWKFVFPSLSVTKRMTVRPSARAIIRLNIVQQTGWKRRGGAACYQRMKYSGLACQPTEFYLTVFYVCLDSSERLRHTGRVSILRIDATVESVDLGGVSGTSKQLPSPLLDRKKYIERKVCNLLKRSPRWLLLISTDIAYRQSTSPDRTLRYVYYDQKQKPDGD